MSEIMKTGSGFPAPKGASASTSSASSAETSDAEISQSIGTSDNKSRGVVFWPTTFSKSVRNAAMFSPLIVRPAARLCPPNFSRCREQSPRPSHRSNPSGLRAEPRHVPSPVRRAARAAVHPVVCSANASVIDEAFLAGAELSSSAFDDQRRIGWQSLI